MQDPNLPPGVSQEDIDRQFGGFDVTEPNETWEDRTDEDEALEPDGPDDNKKD